MAIKPRQSTDIQQLAALHAGEEWALSGLFGQYNRALLYFAKSMVYEQEVAEEIVSDSFVKLWERRETFETSDKIKAFLYIATKNACLNHVKSSHARQEFDAEVSEQLLSVDPDAYAKIVRSELMQAIYEEVSKLPEKQREVFRLTYFDDLNTEEICEELDMTATAVFANRSRAVEALRKIFKDKDMLLCLLLLEELVSSGGQWVN